MKKMTEQTEKLTLSQVWKNEWMMTLLFTVLTFLSRTPYRTAYLYHWDSVNFAVGMYDFNLVLEQPHPPGYLLYVFLARLMDGIIHDPNSTMIWIAIAASALAVGALYLLGCFMFERKTGLLAAGFLFTSPLFWFYGEIALPHTLDAALILLCLLFLYSVWQGNHQHIWASVILLSLAGGFRPQTLVFLLPLTVVAFWPVGLKRFLLAGGLGAALCLTWFIPLMNLSGGIGEYVWTMGAYSHRFQLSTSVLKGAGLDGVIYNLKKLIPYTLFGLGGALGGYVIWFFFLVKEKVKVYSRRTLFFSLWIVPVVLYYTFIHMGQQGLVFVFLPALCLIPAYGIAKFLENKPRLLDQLAGVFVFINFFVFLFMPEYPLGEGTQRFLTRPTLQNSDQYFQTRFDAIEENFDPATTLIAADEWRHAEFYLPEYSILHREPYFVGNVEGSAQKLGLDFDEGSGLMQAAALQHIEFVILEPWQDQILEAPDELQYLDLQNEPDLAYFTLEERMGVQIKGPEIEYFSD